MPTTLGRWTWGWRVTSSNQALPFDRATVNKDATLRLGDYTAGQFATEVARAMNAADTGQTYTCTFDFTNGADRGKFTTANGAAFAFEFTRNATTNAAGLLGYDDVDTAAATSQLSAVAAGASFSLTAGVRTWAPVDPAVSNSPVTAAADGTTAALLQRKPRVVQQETDGGLRETIYFSTDKIFRIRYEMLSAAEQTNFELLLDWITQGAPTTFQPDATSVNALRLVLDPGEISNVFSWTTRTEATYPELVFTQQLSRT